MKNKFIKCFIGMLALLTLSGCSSKRDGITSQPSPGVDNPNPSEIYQPDDTRKIIYKIHYTIESKDNSEIIKDVKNQIFTLNGFISESEENSSNYAYYVYKIPTPSLNTFISYVDDKYNKEITSKQVTSNDVTSSFDKTSAQIKTLEASLTAYQNLLKDEKLTYSDIIQINDKITSINSELTYLYNQIDDITEKTEYTEITFRYYTERNNKSNSEFDRYINFIKQSGITIGYYILYTLPFAAISGIIILVVYLIRRKKKI